MIVIDMELPNTCRSCNLSFDAYGSITEGKCAALRCGVTYMNDRRNPICPIVGEIPDKHGRLIDADKLAVAVAEAQDSMLHKEYDPFMLLGDILRWIDLAPTILEATE